jgi:hypothetical protein
MDELIQQIVKNVGLDDSVAKSAVGNIFQFMKGQMGDADFGAIADKLPGIDGLMAGAASPPGAGAGAGGGLLGSITKMASSVVGGDAGAGLDLMSNLSSLGVTKEQGMSLVQTIVAFLRDNLGAELTDGIVEKIPMLKQLL